MANNREFMSRFAKVAQPAPYPTLAPTSIMPMNVPTEYAVGEVVGANGQKAIAIQFSTPVGVAFYFFSLEAAEAFANAVRSRATGITIVPANGAPG